MTDGNRGNAPLLPFLIRRARLLVKSIRELLADAAYDSRKNFDLLKNLKIGPIINAAGGPA